MKPELKQTIDRLEAVAAACEYCREAVHLYGTEMRGHGADIRYIIEAAMIPAATGTEAKVCKDIAERQDFGRIKYGFTVAENPLTPEQWLTHLYQELLDGAIYAKRLGPLLASAMRAREENHHLREIFPLVLLALGNGSSGADCASCSIQFLSGVPNEVNSVVMKLRQEIFDLKAKLAAAQKIDGDAAQYVESVIVERTPFTGEPPYVGWKGIGLALSQALDERDALRAAKRSAREAWPLGINPEMDDHAIGQGLAHWSCTSKRANDMWIRRDGYAHRVTFSKNGGYPAELRAIDAENEHERDAFGTKPVATERDKALPCSKNLHRLICEASGYIHDERDWPRDIASLAEHVRNGFKKLAEMDTAIGNAETGANDWKVMKDAAEARLKELERKHEDDMSVVVAERDGAEDVIDELCKAIGWKPEWSSAFSFNDAIVEAQERMATFSNRVTQADLRNERLVATGLRLLRTLCEQETWLNEAFNLSAEELDQAYNQKERALIGAHHAAIAVFSANSADHQAHNENCDALDLGPDGIVKPCNCAANGPAPAQEHDLIAHLHRQSAFSLRTFGPGERTKGIIAHIRKELLEIDANPYDLSEWIDVVLLALDGAWRHGGTPESIPRALAAKQLTNEQRKWPDWRTIPQDEAIGHVK